MPLFEIETDSHIIITWADDEAAARNVVCDAYPSDEVVAFDETTPRHVGDQQGSSRLDYPQARPLCDCP